MLCATAGGWPNLSGFHRRDLFKVFFDLPTDGVKDLSALQGPRVFPSPQRCGAVCDRGVDIARAAVSDLCNDGPVMRVMGLKILSIDGRSIGAANKVLVLLANSHD